MSQPAGSLALPIIFPGLLSGRVIGQRHLMEVEERNMLGFHVLRPTGPVPVGCGFGNYQPPPPPTVFRDLA